MSKGSTRRPAHVSQEEVARRWDTAFGPSCELGTFEIRCQSCGHIAHCLELTTPQCPLCQEPLFSRISRREGNKTLTTLGVHDAYTKILKEQEANRVDRGPAEAGPVHQPVPGRQEQESRDEAHRADQPPEREGA